MLFVPLLKNLTRVIKLGSFEEAIEQNPERFVSYLNLNKVKDKQTFINEFYNAFNHDNKGQTIIKHGLKQKVLDILWKSETVQRHVQRVMKKPSKRIYHKDIKEWRKNWEEQVSKEYEEMQRKIEKAKKIKVNQYNREGKLIRPYKKARHEWTEKQKKFIKYRLHYTSNEALAIEFNKFFKTAVSKYAIRDMKYRLKGVKK